MNLSRARSALALPVLLLSLATLATATETVRSDPPAPAAKVNINTADVVELQTLKGVGPSIAQRIVSYREANGRFERIEELMNVRGIGEKTFLRLKDRITVGQPTNR